MSVTSHPMGPSLPKRLPPSGAGARNLTLVPSEDELNHHLLLPRVQVSRKLDSAEAVLIPGPSVWNGMCQVASQPLSTCLT